MKRKILTITMVAGVVLALASSANLENSSGPGKLTEHGPAVTLGRQCECLSVSGRVG
jgi:hypothetical protein